MQHRPLAKWVDALITTVKRFARFMRHSFMLSPGFRGLCHSLVRAQVERVPGVSLPSRSAASAASSCGYVLGEYRVQVGRKTLSGVLMSL